MANNVFANGRELSCKSGAGKSIAAFPDVCMTPPENPTTPPGVPVPYPNTGMASDTTSGSRTVAITGKEVMLKNKSYFKKSTGDEAGSAAKKGVVSSVNRGKVYFASWSMDVKIEGENAVRHLDMTTHNHGSPSQTPPWPFQDSMSFDRFGNSEDPCAEDKAREQSACKGQTVDGCCEECKAARACRMIPKKYDKKMCCSPGNTGHHMIEDHWIKGRVEEFPMAQGNTGYNAAPTVCVEGGRHEKEHGEMHIVQGLIEESHMAGGINADQPWDYLSGKNAALMAHAMTFEDSGCNRKCIETQLDNFYGENPDRKLNRPLTQSLAKKDKGDDRWLRSEAEDSLSGNLRTA